MRQFLLCVLMFSAYPALAQQPRNNTTRTFSAPTYYIIARGQNWSPNGDLVRFSGATNLPAGSQILITVADFNGDAWKDYSGQACVSVSKDGFFSGEIHPKQGLQFRNNLILRADFATNLCQQPTGVLRIVGAKGEHLGEKDAPPGELIGASRNPQLYQVSGWYYGLETIARIE